MDLMQFRDYVFRHNPEKITINGAREIAGHFCPDAGYVAQDLGSRAKTIKCEGCFTGGDVSESLANAAEFRRKCCEKSGVLYVPGLEPVYARLREFAIDLAGDGSIIPYTLLFLETGEG